MFNNDRNQNDEITLVHAQPADSAEHTVAHQEVSEWDHAFGFNGASVKCTALSRMNDAELILDGASFDGAVKASGNIATVTVRGANLKSSQLNKCLYLGIELATQTPVRLTVWGNSQSGSFSLMGIGSNVLGAAEQISSFPIINEEDSSYVSLDRAFNGTLLIPADKLLCNGNGWSPSPITSITIKIKGGQSTVVTTLLTCGSLPAITDTSDSQYAYTSKERLLPYWEGDTAYNESMAMHKTSDGTILGTLLYVPTKIISVKDVYLKKQYVEGVDWVWDEGTNRIIRPEGSSIAYFTENDLSGRDENGELIPPFPEWTNGVSRFGECIYCVSPFLFEKQIAVTYTYDPAQIPSRELAHANYLGDRLPKTIKKLADGKDVRVLFYGDSIFSGCDASSMYNREPYMPYMHQLVQEGLQSAASGKVTVDNIAVGGWSVQNGYEALVGPLRDQEGKEIAGSDKSGCIQSYDLLIMSFGMNDMNVPDAKRVFTDYTTGIIDRIKAQSPDIEVLLVSCMNPNPRVGWNVNQHNHAAWFEDIAASAPYCAGTAVVDFYSAHSSILKHKSFASTTGNNINHPNDWLIRAYAHNILAALIKK